ncbi:hypothetical protein [Limnoglobus roseus]|uniref:Uncharacterized protein n=1 Tax=Limnoglobus roseus TaxID=2598579 RepID=A0A5C1AQD3_9BACT|nr:hypothetical protein [Limnoglobus roseus]QEL19068.1 hypothetical protein PX52LOC_06125 [Limnoglobus roseus]
MSSIETAAVDAATFRRSLNRMIRDEAPDNSGDLAFEINAHRIAEGELMEALGRDTQPTAEELMRLLPPNELATLEDLALIPDADLDEFEAEDREMEEIDTELVYIQLEMEAAAIEAREEAARAREQGLDR